MLLTLPVVRSFIARSSRSPYLTKAALLAPFAKFTCTHLSHDLSQLCHSSRSTGEWAVAEGVLTTLVAVALGNEKVCRRLLQVGLDRLIDAAEDSSGGPEQESDSYGGSSVVAAVKFDTREQPKLTLTKNLMRNHKTRLPAVQGASASSPRSACFRELPVKPRLGLDEIDEIGVDGVLQQGAQVLGRRMQGESKETCSALATSLLQALGPFNYVSPEFTSSPPSSCTF